MIKIVRKIYNNRLDRLLVSCIIEETGVQKEVDIKYLVPYTHKFENATGVFIKNKFYIRRKSNYEEIPESYKEEKRIAKLWHGTAHSNFKPKYGLGRKDNDYGQGLYTTEDPELAKEWAMGFNNRTEAGYVFELELNLTGLKILDLDKYPIECWLAILYKNRKIEGLTGLVKQRMEQFIHKFYIVDTEKYDVIIGYRADDSYFKYAEDFLNVAITKEVLEQALHLGNLGQQVFIQSERAFKVLEVIGNKKVLADYKKKYINRDTKSRQDYIKLQNNLSSNGLTILDILK